MVFRAVRHTRIWHTHVGLHRCYSITYEWNLALGLLFSVPEKYVHARVCSLNPLDYLGFCRARSSQGMNFADFDWSTRNCTSGTFRVQNSAEFVPSTGVAHDVKNLCLSDHANRMHLAVCYQTYHSPMVETTVLFVAWERENPRWKLLETGSTCSDWNWNESAFIECLISGYWTQLRWDLNPFSNSFCAKGTPILWNDGWGAQSWLVFS